MFSNAQVYNEENSELFKDAATLRDAFIKELEGVTSLGMLLVTRSRCLYQAGQVRRAELAHEEVVSQGYDERVHVL